MANYLADFSVCILSNAGNEIPHSTTVKYTAPVECTKIDQERRLYWCLPSRRDARPGIQNHAVPCDPGNSQEVTMFILPRHFPGIVKPRFQLIVVHNSARAQGPWNETVTMTINVSFV